MERYIGDEFLLDRIDFGAVNAVLGAKIRKLLIPCKTVLHLLGKLIGELFQLIDEA